MRVLKNLTTRQRHSLTATVIGAVILAVGFHYWYAEKYDINFINCHYELINPTRCTITQAGPTKEYSAFKDKLSDWVSAQQKQGTLIDAAVYFRDLTNGPIFFINPDSPYAPASLVKVPMMMSYFKVAEKEPDLLTKNVRTPAKFTGTEQTLVQPRLTLEPNTSYSIMETIKRMIISSDNRSLDMLMEYYKQFDADTHPVLSTMMELGMLPENANLNNYLTVKQYSSLWRILYDATYLTPELSNRALDLLTQTDYKNGIVAPLPIDTKVAHKFGVFNDVNSTIQLHDAGIIYTSQGNYILTVMTRANTLEQGEKAIQEISHKVWDEFNSRQQPSK